MLKSGLTAQAAVDVATSRRKCLREMPVMLLLFSKAAPGRLDYLTILVDPEKSCNYM
jgi:hypothetical protein